MNTTARAVGVIAAAWLLVCGASADFLPLFGAPGRELDHTEIFEAVYSPGTAWVPFGTRVDGQGHPIDFTNGALQAVRVDDYALGGVLDANTGAAGLTDDQVWGGGPVTINALARYASYSQRLGYDALGDAAGYVNLFDVSGSGLNVSGTAVLDLVPGQTWAWARAGTGQTYYSVPALNHDQQDHLVTYQLQGLADGRSRWLLCWEDLPNRGDKDYNDLVVELSAPVPEPASAVLLLMVWAAWRRR